jgi:NAD(P)-dependent dehydrogenase (short-subunit alcohol dehydrogenase family)
MTMHLNERVAVVTGASGGLGREVAIALAAAGAQVVLFARSAVGLTESARLTREAGGRQPLAVEGDVSSPDDVQRLAAAAASFGPVSVLVNAAGTFGPIATVADSDRDEWVQTLLTNTVGPYLTARAFVPLMIEMGWGRIVNVSSAAAFMDAGPLNSAYSVSKTALNRFTRHLAAELLGTGVNVNVLHPGSLKTPMWADIRRKAERHPEAQVLRDWAALVDETGGDSMDEAVHLVMSLVDPRSELSGSFCWPANMHISEPLPTW